MGATSIRKRAAIYADGHYCRQDFGGSDVTMVFEVLCTYIARCGVGFVS